MDIYCNGTAKVRHAVTGEVYSISAEELDWQDAGGDERPMGPAFHYEALVEHPELGLMSWGVWEYPEGAENMTESNVGKHIIVEDFDFGLYHPEPEGWWEELAEVEDPHSAFLGSYRETMALLDASGSSEGWATINRMVFSHQITALETYLADTLVNEVLKDPAAERRLVAEATDLNEQKFTLAQITNSPTLAREKVVEFLRGVIYHNIPKVDALYQIALGIKILPLIPNRRELLKAVDLRHDCVHRNGYDKQGIRHTVFTVPFVKSTADQIRQFVQAVDEATLGRERTDSAA